MAGPSHVSHTLCRSWNVVFVMSHLQLLNEGTNHSPPDKTSCHQALLQQAQENCQYIISSLHMQHMPPEVIAHIAAGLDGANRHTLRTTARAFNRAMRRPGKDETIAVMLKHALKAKVAVTVWCHRLPGPLEENPPYLFDRSFSFSPRMEPSQKGKFRVFYQPGNLGQDLWSAFNVVLSHSATIHECLAFLKDLCNIKRAALFQIITTDDASLSLTPLIPGSDRPRGWHWNY